MGNPIDRTTKSALDSNLVNGNTSDAPKVKANNDNVYNYVDGLNSAQDAHASASTLAHPDGSVKTAKIADGAVTTPKYADVSITRPKIAIGAVGSSQLDPILLTNYGDIAVQAEFDRRGISVMKYGAKGDGVKDDTAAIKAAINSIISTGGTVYFPAGTYLVSSPIDIKQGLRIVGNSKTSTTIKNTGGAASPLFQDKTGDWGTGIVFENLQLIGDGTNKDTGTNYGVYVGDDTLNDLSNTPWVRFYNCAIKLFKRGIYLEGYGHTFIDTFVNNCDRGIILFHPEQACAYNSWVEYCNVGVDINPDDIGGTKYNQAGHRFIWDGGAIQRNVVGLRAYNFYHLRVNSYAELNTQNDIILGKWGSTDYSRGVHGAVLDVNVTSNSVSDCNIKLANSQDVEIRLGVASNGAQTVPHVRTDGWSKYISVIYETETLISSSPWDFQGNSAKSVILRTMNTEQYISNLGLSEKFSDGGVEYAQRRSNYLGSRNSIEYFMENGMFAISSNNNSAGFQLYDYRTGVPVLMGYWFPGGNLINQSTSFETLLNGGGVYVKTPDGTKRYLISVDNTGALKTTLS